MRKERQANFRISDEDYRVLNELSKEEKVTTASILRTALWWYYEKKQGPLGKENKLLREIIENNEKIISLLEAVE